MHRKSLRFKDRDESGLNCFAMHLVNCITRCVQNNDHSNFAHRMAQTELTGKLIWENVLDKINFL